MNTSDACLMKPRNDLFTSVDAVLPARLPDLTSTAIMDRRCRETC